DSSGTAILPIIGIPGAALLASRLEFGADIHNAVISPKQDYALAVRSDDGSIVIATLRTDPPTLISVAGTRSNPSVLAISPAGGSAAVYDSVSGSLQIVGHLPESPEVMQEFDLSGMPGTASAVALSDDGAVAVVSFTVDDGRNDLWVIAATGSWRVGTEG